MPTRKTTRKPASTAKAPAANTNDARAVEAFLAKVPRDKRAALQSLRKTMKAAAQAATEGISYGVPMLKLNGRPLVSFGYGAHHCSFYVQSPALMRAHAADLKAYDTAAGTIHFSADRPLPAALVTKLVKARIREIDRAS
jgi:uncharacterized protein YdhG (YjbR/CyaY superfamily)